MTWVSHLDAVQGSQEERASRTSGTVSKRQTPADAAMRQEPGQCCRLCRQAGQGDAKARMILLFGNVGSGKGTQAELLAKKLNCQTLSSGEILRQYKDRQDIQTAMAEGKLVSDDILLPLMDTEIKKATSTGLEVVLDGFPRNIHQTQWLIDEVNQGGVHITAVIHLVLSKEAAMQRLLNRQRPDDTREGINQRFSEYEQKVLPAIEYLKNAGLVVKEVNADQTVEAVAKDIEKALQ